MRLARFRRRCVSGNGSSRKLMEYAAPRSFRFTGWPTFSDEKMPWQGEQAAFGAVVPPRPVAHFKLGWTSVLRSPHQTSLLANEGH